MNLRDLEETVRKLKLECPNPIVRIECSPAFYKVLKLIPKEVSKPVRGINRLYFGSLWGIPVIEVPDQIEPFKFIRVDDMLGEGS